MHSVDERRKKRGAFFTPQPIAQFLADWAIRSPSDAVLEPSCGEAVFLEAAGRRLGIISRANQKDSVNLRGIELHQESALNAACHLKSLGYDAEVECRNFFDVTPTGTYDVVLGNPPFVRYQTFAGDARIRALRAALAQGVPLRRLASAWAAFLIHASAFVSPVGRLGFVLPAELLATHYAAEVRSFLLRRFGSLKIILFESLVFPGVTEEIILLLAEGSGGCSSFEVVQVKDLACLHNRILRGNGYAPPHPLHKWTNALLHQEAQSVLCSLGQSKDFESLREWGNIFLGFVTGNNAFFTLTEQSLKTHGLTEQDVIKICPPGARRLNCLSLQESTWRTMRNNGAAGYLFYPHSNPSRKARNYIESGIRQRVQAGYKCANRRPWWQVPLPEKPDLIFTYMNHQMPRLIHNAARVQVSNSVYGVSLHRNRKSLGREMLPRLFFNSISALSGEVEGRSYGGGLLKHEPREADRILVPSLSLVARLAEELDNLDLTHVQPSEYASVCQRIDEILLQSGALGSREALSIVQRARGELLARRAARNRQTS
jgi:adenine-specific DNA methylase